MPYGRALHERGTALLRCKALLPRASCGVHFMSRLVRVACFCTRLRCLSLGRRRSTHAYRARAPRRAGLLKYVGSHPLQAYCPSERPVSVGAMPRCNVPAAKPPRSLHFAWRLRVRSAVLGVSDIKKTLENGNEVTQITSV